MRWKISGEISTDGVTDCTSVEKRTNMNKELQSLVEQTPKEDILVVQGD